MQVIEIFFAAVAVGVAEGEGDALGVGLAASLIGAIAVLSGVITIFGEEK